MSEQRPKETSTCIECGMPVKLGQYHPFAACLMFKQCHNSETVQANLWSIVDFGRELERAKR
jgi:hypothetical protein